MSLKPIWALQKSCMHDADATGMIDAITELDLNYQLLNVTPFTYDNIPDVVYDGPIIPYGGTRYIDKIRLEKQNWWCMFNNNFMYSKYIEHYGKHMFNSDGVCMKMKDFSPSSYTRKEFLFIRPNKDLKEFAGFNTRPEDFMNWYRKIKNQDWDVGDNTEIIVAKSSKIDREWRIFMINDICLDGSQYRNDHYLSVKHEVPKNVREFAEQMANIWVPSCVYTMDVCELNGELFILELGDFHSSGWYLADKKYVINEVTNYAMSHHPKYEVESRIIEL